MITITRTKTHHIRLFWYSRINLERNRQIRTTNGPPPQPTTMTTKDVANLIVSTLICSLATRGFIDLALRILFVWSILDCVLLSVFPPRDRDFKHSLVVHHVIVCALCWQYQTLSGTVEWIRAILLLEFSTPFLCLHNILQTRTTLYLRTLAWVGVRGVTSVYLLFLMNRLFLQDERVYESSPYVVALILLSVSWTFRSLPHVSSLSLLLVSYAAYRQGFSLFQWLLPLLHVPISCAFHNCAERYVGFWRGLDHASITVCALVLYQDCHVLSAVVGVAIMAHMGITTHTANLMGGYLTLRVPTAERTLLGVIMGGYIALTGPRNLSFGHRIAWHTVCTSVLMKCLRDTRV